MLYGDPGSLSDWVGYINSLPDSMKPKLSKEYPRPEDPSKMRLYLVYGSWIEAFGALDSLSFRCAAGRPRDFKLLWLDQGDDQVVKVLSMSCYLVIN